MMDMDAWIKDGWMDGLGTQSLLSPTHPTFLIGDLYLR